MSEKKTVKLYDLDLLSAAIESLANVIWNDSNAARRDFAAHFENIAKHIENLKRLVGENDLSEINLEIKQSPRQLENIIKNALQGIFERVTDTETRERKNPDDYFLEIDKLSHQECVEAKTSLNFIQEKINEIYANLRAEKYRFTLSTHY